MNEMISPKYQMKLIASVCDQIWIEYKTNKEILRYIEKWHVKNDYFGNDVNFHIITNINSSEIDLEETLHNMDGDILLKIAIDLGVDTPNFIPAVPIFKNELKSSYKTAYDTFIKAYKLIESDPSLAIGLANSSFESIIKEILKDERIGSKITGQETLTKLTKEILKQFKLYGKNFPNEVKLLGNSLININKVIEDIRSQKTEVHGKTTDDILINDSIYAFLIVNSITTVGTFLNSYYKTMFPKSEESIEENTDDLPF